jgi:hypothetical protein
MRSIPFRVNRDVRITEEHVWSERRQFVCYRRLNRSKKLGNSFWVTTKKTIPALSAGLLGAMLSASPVHAVPLAPGGTVALSGTTEAAHPYLAGTVVEDVLRPFTIKWASTGKEVSGEIQDRVVRESTGDLDFYYRLEFKENYATDQLIVSRGNFPRTLATDVDYRTDGVGVAAPFQAHRGPEGRIIWTTFKNFSVTPGSAGSTRFVFVHTTDRVYHPGGLAQITTNNGGLATVTVFQPGLP